MCMAISDVRNTGDALREPTLTFYVQQNVNSHHQVDM